MARLLARYLPSGSWAMAANSETVGALKLTSASDSFG
jgi:hypothetical protein